MFLEFRRTCALAILSFAILTGAAAQATSAQPAPPDPQLFAVEIKVGPKWDQAKLPQDQAFFKEHSANLRRMRDAGMLVVGARYSDKGLLVVSGSNSAEVRAQMDQDPSFGAGTFVYEVHALNVFYPGDVKTRARR